MSTEVELQRRLQSGSLTGWEVADDPGSPTGVSDPTMDVGARERLQEAVDELQAVVAALSGTLQVAGAVDVDNFPAEYSLPADQEQRLVDITSAVNALQDALAAHEQASIAVDNFPDEYPDPEAQNLLDAIHTAIQALETQTDALTDAQLRAVPLDVDTGIQQPIQEGGSVQVSNQPSEFPLPAQQLSLLEPKGEVGVTNFPSHYPDIVAHDRLSTLIEEIESLKAEIESGVGVSGSVDVDNLPQVFPNQHAQGLTNSQLRSSPVPVDIGEASVTIDELTVEFDSVISEANTPEEPLAADEIFEGEWEEVLQYAAITVVFNTDAPSAINGARIQFSVDAENVTTEAYTTHPGGDGSFVLRPRARFMRVRYANGPQAQSFLQAEIAYQFNAPAHSQSPIATPMLATDMAVTNRAIIAGDRGDGTYGFARVTEQDEIATADRFLGGQVLPDQSGEGVRTFTFEDDVHLVWVRTDGGDGRVDPFGDDPAQNVGIPAEDGIPVPLTVTTDEIKVYLPGGVSCSVWGFR